MAYRELGVIEIREVLRRFCVGEGVRARARGTGSDRKTVGKYVAPVLAAGLRRGPDGRPCGGRLVRDPRRARRPAGRGAERLAPHREQITAWLADNLRPSVTRQNRMYIRTPPTTAVSTFCRLLLELSIFCSPGLTTWRSRLVPSHGVMAAF